MRRYFPARTLSSAVGLACLLALETTPRATFAACPPDQLFAPPALQATGPNPRRQAVGDFDGDGITDLAIAVASAGLPAASRIEIRLGQGSGGVGNGSFGAGLDVPVGPRCFAVVAGHFDGDANLDLAVANASGNSVAILLGRGNAGGGLFEAPQYFPAGAAPHNLVAGHFDGDGHLDVAVANNGTSVVTVLLGNGDGTLAPSTSYPIHDFATGIALGDFDEDGISDLVATSNFSGEVAVLLGNGVAGEGDGTFAAAVHYAAGPEPYDIAVGDFDDDGVSDLAVANTASGGIRILRGQGVSGTGDGTFLPPLTFAGGSNAPSVAILDANGDDIDDLAFTATNPNRLGVLLGNGSSGDGDGTFANGPSFTVGSNPAGLVAGDFNEDGTTDLACIGYDSSNFAVLIGSCGQAEPTVTDVRDVPNDQGGHVFLTWLRSGLDVPPNQVITGYRVWRRIPAAKAAMASADIVTRKIVTPDGAQGVTYWEALVTLPAQYLPGYGYTAPTTQDSVAGGNPYTAFFVTALTANPFVFYESNVDSGYSVDNLAPGPPALFVGTLHPNGGTRLEWAAGDETDLIGYRLYRGTTTDFVPGPDNLVATLSGTEYVDAEGTTSHVYKLAAVDAHGNASAYAEASMLTVATAVGDPGVAFALEGPRPHPARGERMTIAFSLPSAGPATLELLDLSGRRIVWRDVGAFGAGRHTVDLGTRGMRPGIYWVRLSHGGSSLTTKVARVE
jgi:hypothetical protein